MILYMKKITWWNVCLTFQFFIVVIKRKIVSYFDSNQNLCKLKFETWQTSSLPAWRLKIKLLINISKCPQTARASGDSKFLLAYLQIHFLLIFSFRFAFQLFLCIWILTIQVKCQNKISLYNRIDKHIKPQIYLHHILNYGMP